MNTAVINLRTDRNVKQAAQKTARDLGFNLSSILNAFLRDFVRAKSVNFSVAEEPSEYLVKAIAEAEEDLRMGKTYSFVNADEALDFLDKKVIGKTKKNAR